MRLLHLEDDDKFSLVELIGKDIPPYAILSHTWKADQKEVQPRLQAYHILRPFHATVVPARSSHEP
jgi:hypothetical protein